MLSLKKRLKKYHDISWLMPAVDVVDVLERMGAEQIIDKNDEVQCLCPDHYMHVGRISSHPKWSCNTETGETYCPTEPRGSNLLYTVCRVLECSPEDAIKFMTGSDESFVRNASIRNRLHRMRQGEDVKEKKKPLDLKDIPACLQERRITERCYQFFQHPPGKFPTNIKPETVDRYQVFEKISGSYVDRAIIPFFKEGGLVGFCAIDLLGKEEWLRRHPFADENDYKKTLYPSGFRGKEYLFGLEDCEKNSEYLIVTEGAREVMKLWQEGFTNAVGCLKAVLSDEQIQMLTQLAPKELVMMFDGDEAGWRANDKNADKVSSLFNVRKCYLPVGKDPKNFSEAELKDIVSHGRIHGKEKRRRK